MDKQPDRLLLTVTEASALLGFCRWKVQDLIRRGEIGFIPLGKKHKRIPRAEAERWIRENTIQTQEQFMEFRRKYARRRGKA